MKKLILISALLLFSVDAFAMRQGCFVYLDEESHWLDAMESIPKTCDRGDLLTLEFRGDDPNALSLGARFNSLPLEILTGLYAPEFCSFDHEVMIIGNRLICVLEDNKKRNWKYENRKPEKD